MRVRAASDTLTLQDYLAIMRRRKWIVLLPILVVPAVAYVLAARQTPLYESSADVWLNRLNLAAALTGTEDPAAKGDPERLVQTQRVLAREPEVMQLVIQRLGLRHTTAQELLAASSVDERTGADVLTFTVRAATAVRAETIATEYARQFTNYRSALDTAAIRRAQVALQQQLVQLQRRLKDAGAVRDLLSKSEELRAMQALESGNVAVVRVADGAAKVRPQPARTTAVAFGIAAILAIIAAFVREAFDRRVLSIEALADRLQVDVLARVPQSRRLGRARQEPALLHEPRGRRADAFRALPTSIGFATADAPARCLLVAGASHADHASVVAANLGVAFAQSGRRVALVDLDLRRPTIDWLFGAAPHGFTDVLDGVVGIESALTEVQLEPAGRPRRHGLAGTLHVLRAGTASALPADPTDGAAALLLRLVRRRFDVTIVAGPPLLDHHGALALTAQADALLVALRAKPPMREPDLRQLQGVLKRSRAHPLGLVLLDASTGTARVGAVASQRFLLGASSPSAPATLSRVSSSR